MQNNFILYLIDNYEYSEMNDKELNYTKIPVNHFDINESNVLELNKILEYCDKLKEENLIIKRTKSGGISIKGKFVSTLAYDVQVISSGLEITLLTYYYNIEYKTMRNVQFRFQFRSKIKNEDNENVISGRKAFNIFNEKCIEYGIDLNNYVIDNGKEIKKDIPSYIISKTNNAEFDKIYENAHHIDFHSSFPSGLVNTHPEFYDVVNYFYKRRKEDKKCKSVLNNTIGFMQSITTCNAKWANLSRDAIIDNNKRLWNLYFELKKSNRKPLLFNTDGIWYQGEIYHGDNEGKNLCQWENDHINCKLRIKSAGAYEFIENNKYYPVLRGHTLYDNIKDREEWEWGDIYRNDCNIIKYRYNEINNRIEVLYEV